MVIDFTNLPVRNKTYAGANGSKISVIYNNELYMLKFPPVASINKNMSYANGCISEYIGCHVFESVGIPAQKTLLGTYMVGEKEKIVVACKDFTSEGFVLQDFASLKNTIIDSSSNGYGTELNDIVRTLKEQSAIDCESLIGWFWDMFIVDALIGNWDRHNGNWGFLYNSKTDRVSLAPIYGCASALFPQADDGIMERVLNNTGELEIRIYERPLSAIKINGQKIQYFKFISLLKNEDCNNALKRILPKIDMDKIYEIVDGTPFVSALQKDFYKTILLERKKRILDFSYQKLCKKERYKNKMR